MCDQRRNSHSLVGLLVTPSCFYVERKSISVPPLLLTEVAAKWAFRRAAVMEKWPENNSSSWERKILMWNSRRLRKWPPGCCFYFEHFRVTQIELMMFSYSSKATQKWQGPDLQRCTSCSLGEGGEPCLGVGLSPWLQIQRKKVARQEFPMLPLASGNLSPASSLCQFHGSDSMAPSRWLRTFYTGVAPEVQW